MAVKMNAYLTVMIMLVMVTARTMVAAGEDVSCGNSRSQEETGRLCNPFTRGDQPEPSAECCSAFKEYRKSSAKTKEERKKMCLCVQKFTYDNTFDPPGSAPPAARVSRIDALPAKCGAPFIFSADRKFDCNKVER